MLEKIYEKPWPHSLLGLLGYEDPYTKYLFKVVSGLLINYCKGGLLLDVGFGSGKHLYFANDMCCSTVGVEVSFKLIRIVRALKGRGPELVVASAEFLPFRSDSFNYVLCTEVLEHLRGLGLAIHEIKRVLKNDGISIVSVPNFQDFTPLWLLLHSMGVNPLLVWRIAAKIFGYNPEKVERDATAHVIRKAPTAYLAYFKAEGFKILSMNSILCAPRLIPASVYRKFYSNRHILKITELVDRGLGKHVPFNLLGQGTLFVIKKVKC
jgi:ubiquinone/menaquinone biosynthesis C-methylase UbiE